MLITLLTPEQLVELDRRIGARADALIAVRQRAKPQTLTKTTNRGRPSKSIHNPFFSFIGYGTSYERYPQFAMDIVEGIARLDWHDRAIGLSGKSMPLSVRNLMVTLESLPVVSTAAVGELLGVKQRHSQRYVKAIGLILPYMMEARPESLVVEMAAMQDQDAA
ncbi:hypothetical protein [Pseudomonas putida]|uniref:hypothetical protein n=1 Tax=Pseudomonas putida TaxID=303 RepID=UPI000819352F|nr:hypothetical protein [Pseudomonas putida]OCT24005.1 hypothetical protein A6E23_13850 [Pseudomonas putida]OCT27084.1 hypothetical protein A6E20_06810 [Pseudomonas putida]OCT28368.1 hypothetical protein A6E24_06625 [Pseudomonas putida]OCT38398.1 hypothetical protein A6E19_14670 [Pseudomonas putida]